jgi:hypothetical protein
MQSYAKQQQGGLFIGRVFHISILLLYSYYNVFCFSFQTKEILQKIKIVFNPLIGPQIPLKMLNQQIRAYRKQFIQREQKINRKTFCA